MKGKTWLLTAGLFLLLGVMQTSAMAFAREGMRGGDADDRIGAHEGFHGGHFGPRVFGGPGFGFGWGWGDPWYWGPYSYDPWPGVVEVHHVNYGTVEFKVKPENTKVYVDQKYIGTVKDLDHHKAYMPAGNHEIKLVAPDNQTMDRTLYVAAGQKIKINEDL
jgi:hypothetical protein